MPASPFASSLHEGTVAPPASSRQGVQRTPTRYPEEGFAFSEDEACGRLDGRGPLRCPPLMPTPIVTMRLESDEFDTSQLQLFELTGTEALSRLFSFDVRVVCVDPEGLDDLVLLRDPLASGLAKALAEQGDAAGHQFARCIGEILAMHLARPELPEMKLIGRLSDSFPNPPATRVIQLDPRFVSRYIGREVSAAQIEGILAPLAFGVRPAGERLDVTVPSFRATKDITIEVYNPQGQKVLAYNVYRCWVSEYQALPQLDASANAVMISTIKLENEGWVRDTSVTDLKET